MSDLVIDIVAVPDHPAGTRWRAVAPEGLVAGTAGLQPIMACGQNLQLPGNAAVEPETRELNLYVDPWWRGRGIGSRLLAAVREQTAEPRLAAEVAAGSPGEAFLLRHGFRHIGFRRRHLLTYCDVHRAWIGELVDAGRPGYRLTHWTGDLLDGSGAGELLPDPGNTVLTLADADGETAAHAVAVVGALPRARQYGPAVLPRHRGRRLGLWVNAGLIQRLHEVHPHINEIEAATAEDDLRLLAAREQLGFRPLGRTLLYELALR